MRQLAQIMVLTLPEADYWGLLDYASKIGLVTALTIAGLGVITALTPLNLTPAMFFAGGGGAVGVFMFFVLADVLFTCKSCKHPLSAHKNRKKTFAQCKRKVFKKGIAGLIDQGKQCTCTAFVFELRPFTDEGQKEVNTNWKQHDCAEDPKDPSP